MTESKTRDQLLEQIKLQRKNLEEAFFYTEKNDLDTTCKKLDSVYKAIDQIAEKLNSDYKENLFNVKLKKFLKVKEIFEEQRSLPKENLSIDELKETLYNLDMSLIRLNGEVKQNYPASIPLTRFAKKHKNTIIKILPLILLLVVAGMVWKQQKSKHHGLEAEFFASKNFKKSIAKRIDKTIFFKWGRRPPTKNYTGDSFSARWKGFIYIPEKGPYTFLTWADDGVKLWIGKEKIIDDWAIHAEKKNSGTIDLEKGYYPIKIEYFDAGNTASMQLWWITKPGRNHVVVPAKNLFSSSDFLDQNIPIHN